MESIFHARKNKGNKICTLDVFRNGNEFCLHYLASGRTNPDRGEKRERFTIFEKKITVEDIDHIDFESLPITSHTPKFLPIAECFKVLTDDFLSQNISSHGE
ncbi:hypothetical protein FH968_19955 [Buttiauxella sp. B2]|uniref:hypothetical protein n=1 Tax=Buttiauxella sp. B2 TaxID=2587812 RepID=UPI001121D0DE|nr:hypothetical protein [Buttiauxella sp. B2]TNV16116.1 hypothetical protein FH968_19955 [Buttiauxella sp. B2]